MRKIERIVLHCSGGPSAQTAASIRNYHLLPVSRGGLGWRTPGYHYVVEADGRVVRLVDEAHPSNGVRGYNASSVHVCYTGGLDSKGVPADTRTPAQRAALLRLVNALRGKYPRAAVLGHRDLSPDRNGDGHISPDEWVKSCPCFDAAKEYNR